jgi:hypothetical protein
MITNEKEKDIIISGLHFMRSITEAHGAEEGMRLWEAIGDTLGHDLKGKIFFAMVAGTHNDTIVLKNIKVNSNAVSCIKEIRHWTGLGLKEAKDTYDWLMNGKMMRITVKPAEHHLAIKALSSVGFEV